MMSCQADIPGSIIHRIIFSSFSSLEEKHWSSIPSQWYTRGILRQITQFFPHPSDLVANFYFDFLRTPVLSPPPPHPPNFLILFAPLTEEKKKKWWPEPSQWRKELVNVASGGLFFFLSIVSPGEERLYVIIYDSLLYYHMQ